jgi:hypothetical protein
VRIVRGFPAHAVPGALGYAFPAAKAGAHATVLYDRIEPEEQQHQRQFDFAFGFNFTSSPTLLTTTPAGGIGVYDPTFALGPFDSDQNLIEDDTQAPAAAGSETN